MIETHSVKIDPGNPGWFFACCGLLEYADRLWKGAEGWFAGRSFHLRPSSERGEKQDVLTAIREIVINNIMTAEQIARLEALGELPQKSLKEADILEKKALESLRREAPIRLEGRVGMRIDWFHDEWSGGSRFKTWAGQQSVLEITRAMKAGLCRPGTESHSLEECLQSQAEECGLPFNFDSDLGGQGSARDIGFSIDSLSGNAATRIPSAARPGLELLAFIGLQRFRPRQLGDENRYLYRLWNQPMTPEIASVACSAVIGAGEDYEFRLLYRTKYLKSFLPGIRAQGDQS